MTMTVDQFKARPTEGRIVVPFEIKAAPKESRTFEGHAAAFSLDLGDDRIHPGAFTDTLKSWNRGRGRSVVLLDSHKTDTIKAGLGLMTEAEEDKTGLATKFTVIDGRDGDDALDRIRSKIVTKMSIGYRATSFDFEEDEKARFGIVRNLKAVELLEVSLVLFPMNPDAAIDPSTVKAMIAAKEMTPDTLQRLSVQLDDLKSAIASALEPPGVDAPDTTRLDQLILSSLRPVAR